MSHLRRRTVLGLIVAAATFSVPSAALAAPPTATDDSLAAAGAGTLDVLANDTDPEGDALTVTGSGAPTHGTAGRARRDDG